MLVAVHIQPRRHHQRQHHQRHAQDHAGGIVVHFSQGVEHGILRRGDDRALADNDLSGDANDVLNLLASALAVEFGGLLVDEHIGANARAHGIDRHRDQVRVVVLGLQIGFQTSEHRLFLALGQGGNERIVRVFQGAVKQRFQRIARSRKQRLPLRVGQRNGRRSLPLRVVKAQKLFQQIVQFRGHLGGNAFIHAFVAYVDPRGCGVAQLLVVTVSTTSSLA